MLFHGASRVPPRGHGCVLTLGQYMYPLDLGQADDLHVDVLDSGVRLPAGIYVGLSLAEPRQGLPLGIVVLSAERSCPSWWRPGPGLQCLRDNEDAALEELDDCQGE